MIPTNRTELENRIVTCYQDGASIRSLARQFETSRNTIRKILRSHLEERVEGHRALKARKGLPRSSKLDAYVARIQRLLEKYPEITATRVYEEIRGEGFSGGISIVRARVRQLRPQPVREPVVRFETEPGEQGQMDWSPYTIPFLQGGKKTVLCFSYILAYSRRQYVDFFENRDFYTMIRAHRAAFEYFGGVPKHCLYDGEKTVLLRWEAGRPVYNPAFVDFLTYYRCRPLGCRPRRPQTKGKVEAGFAYLEKNLLNGRTFLDLDDLRRETGIWLREKADRRIHRTTRQSPLDRFALERDHLQELPPHPYDTSEVVFRVCSLEGTVQFQTNRYSVPFRFIGEILTLKATDSEVMIYDPEVALIAKHQRETRGKACLVEDAEHRRFKRRRYGLASIQKTFVALGEGAQAFLEGLIARGPRQAGYIARQILCLRETWHSQDIAAALSHASTYHAYNLKAVRSILSARSQPRQLERTPAVKAAQEQLTRLPAITQRSLQAYEGFLDHGANHE